MIRIFRHKGLARFFKSGNPSGFDPTHARRLRLILGRLNAATGPQDMQLPQLRLQELINPGVGIWSVDVSERSRLIFTFNGPDSEVLDFEESS